MIWPKQKSPRPIDSRTTHFLTYARGHAYPGGHHGVSRVCNKLDEDIILEIDGATREIPAYKWQISRADGANSILIGAIGV